MSKVLIESERLLIRHYEDGDEAAVFELNSDPIVQEHTGDTLLHTLEEARNILVDVVFRDYEEHGYGRMAVVYKPDNKLIGFTGFKYLPNTGGMSDLGYRFIPKYWGRGIATESAAMSLKFGFEELGLKTVYAFAKSENAASVRVLQKLGFSLDKLAPYPGEDEEEVIEWYTLAADDYAKNQLELPR